MALLLVSLPKYNRLCDSSGPVVLKRSILTTTSGEIYRGMYRRTEVNTRRIVALRWMVTAKLDASQIIPSACWRRNLSRNRSSACSSATFGVLSNNTSQAATPIASSRNSCNNNSLNCISNAFLSFAPYSWVLMQENWRSCNNQQLNASFTTTSTNQRRQRPRVDENSDKEIEEEENDANVNTKPPKERYLPISQEERWQQHYEQLRLIVKNYNSNQGSLQNEQQETILPKKCHSVPLPDDLMAWLHLQQHKLRLYRKQRLNGDTTKLSHSTIEIMEDRMQKLRELGYSIFPRDFFWDKNYNDLCDFLVKYDGKFPYDAEVADKLKGQEKKLLHWCQRQKRMYRNFQRSATRRENGDSHENDHNNLSSSVGNDDNHFNDDEKYDNDGDNNDDDTMTTKLPSRLVKARIHKLEQVGFVFNSNDTRWNMMFECLVEYYKEHGNCLVPRNYPPNMQLAPWIHGERHDYKLYQRNDPRTTISIERIKKLNSINFEWNALDAKWMLRYNDLEDFVKGHSPGVFPPYKKYSSLHNWLKYQQNLKDKKLNSCGVTEVLPTTRDEPAIEAHGLTVEEKIALLQKLGYFLD